MAPENTLQEEKLTKAKNFFWNPHISVFLWVPQTRSKRLMCCNVLQVCTFFFFYCRRKSSQDYCDWLTPPKWFWVIFFTVSVNLFRKQPLLRVFEHTAPHHNKLTGFSLFMLVVREQTVPQTCRRFYFKASTHVQITAGSHSSSSSSSYPLFWNTCSESLSFRCWTKSKVIFCHHWVRGVRVQICQS